MQRIGSLLILVCALSLVIGCGGGGGGDGGDVGDIMPITTRDEASFAAQSVSEVIDTVLENLADATYNDEVVYGISGNASVTGDYYHYSVDYSPDHFQSWSATDITIVFTDYTAAWAGNYYEATLSGTVTYTDNTWSWQDGENYSSGGSVVMAGGGVSFYMCVWFSNWTLDRGWQDTISFEAGEECCDGYLIGWLVPSNGVTYYI